MTISAKIPYTKFIAPLTSAAFLTLFSPTFSFGAHIEVTSQPIMQFRSRDIGESVGDLIWRGGLVLEGPRAFGGISGMTFLDSNRVVLVSDRGQFITGLLEYDQGHPIGFSDVQSNPIRNSSGNPLPPNYSRDAEGIDTIYREGQVAAIRVSFENLTRVADFDILSDQPTGPAREVSIPIELTNLRTNESLESVCIATDASPVAGSTLLITERYITPENTHFAWLLGKNDKGPMFLSVASGVNPTDCSFLPNGDLLVLERGTGFLEFTMQLRRIPSSEVVPGATLNGSVILTGSGSDIDNMEAMGVRIAQDGSTRIVLMSDDNFNDWERTLLLEFELPG